MPRVALALLVLLCSAAAPVLAQAGHDARSHPRYLVKERRPGEGQQCIVCDKRIFGEDVVEIRYQGRKFYVGAELLREFEQDPDRYFRKIQVHSALFDESALKARQMSWGWMWFGAYMLIGLICSAITGYVAVSKALPALPWFFAGLVGNVAALAVVLFVPRGDASALPAGIPIGLRKVPTTRTPTPCPHCGTPNHPAAARCTDCGRELSPSVAAETAP